MNLLPNTWVLRTAVAFSGSGNPYTVTEDGTNHPDGHLLRDSISILPGYYCLSFEYRGIGPHPRGGCLDVTQFDGPDSIYGVDIVVNPDGSLQEAAAWGDGISVRYQTVAAMGDGFWKAQLHFVTTLPINAVEVHLFSGDQWVYQGLNDGSGIQFRNAAMVSEVVATSPSDRSTTMPQGLSVSRVVDVQVSFAPLAAPLLNFDTLLILGDSNVVDTGEAIREYNRLEDVAADFGTTAPEYLGASLFFSQRPQPTTLYIGRWARTATSGVLAGGFLGNSDQILSKWTSVTTGAFKVSVDGGAPTDVTGIDLSLATNLNGVASRVTAALAAHVPPINATCVWTGEQFKITSATTGATSSVGYLQAPAAGQDLSVQMKMTAALAERTGAGVAAETPVAAVARLDGRGWYAVTFCASRVLSDAEHLAIAGYIEGAEMHLYGLTSSSSNIGDPATTLDLASQLMLAGYMRTVGQFSTDGVHPYGICSLFGRAFTVNFEGFNTTITMKFKQEPGVTAEVLPLTTVNAIETKRFNVLAQYENGTAILEQGVMSGPAFFDEIHGTDWLANRLQTDIWNILVQSPKIPQTNPGIQILIAGAEGGLSQAVTNGLVAPGRWNSTGFGSLSYGDYMGKGWYAWANSVDDQPQSIREARIAPLIQVAIKLAGAVHFSDVLVNVNR
jgi:hypothetical protein